MDDAIPSNLITAIAEDGVAMPHALTCWLDALNAHESGDPPLPPAPLDEIADYVRQAGSFDELPTLALLDEIQGLRFRAAEGDVDLAERVRLGNEVGALESMWACLVSAVLGDEADETLGRRDLTRRAMLRAQEMRGVRMFSPAATGAGDVGGEP